LVSRLPSLRKMMPGLCAGQWLTFMLIVRRTLSQEASCNLAGHCNGHGVCTGPISKRCDCYDGWGSESDAALYGATGVIGDCTTRICPSGPGWNSIPTGTNTAHTLQECSGVGICERAQGNCKCFNGFTGDSCQRSEFCVPYQLPIS